jgi:membrane protease YdiL (CAAX protease family)
MTTVPAASHPSPPEHPELPEGVPGRRLPPPWPPWMALAALLTGFGMATLIAILVGGIGAVFGASISDPPPAVGVLSVIGQDLSLIGAALLFARMVAQPMPWQFALVPPRRLWSSIGLIVAGYVAFITISYLWLTVIGQTDTKDTIAEDLGADRSTLALIAVTFVVTVCAPIAEEFFFRGFMFGTLRRQGLWVAAGVTGLAFGLVHVFGSPIAFIVPLALLGIGLCLLRERTGSLYPGIALHSINNAAAMASSEHWSWQAPVAILGSLVAIALIVRLGLDIWRRSLV